MDTLPRRDWLKTPVKIEYNNTDNKNQITASIIILKCDADGRSADDSISDSAVSVVEDRQRERQ